MEKLNIQLRVQGWSSPRHACIDGERIVFEVMFLECACESCRERLKRVLYRMDTRTEDWNLECVCMSKEKREYSICLVVKPKEMPSQVDKYLSDLLRLHIECDPR